MNKDNLKPTKLCQTSQEALSGLGKQYYIQLFRERLLEKSIEVHATSPKGGLGIHWNFAFWPRGNFYKFVFLHVEILFSSHRGPISVALFLLSQVFE